MGIWEDLTKAFDVPLVAFGGDNGIEVALENIDAPTDIAEPYIAGFMLPAAVVQGDLTVNEFRNGIYQVDINYPSVIGSATVNRLADALNEAFKTGQTLSFGDICVLITSFEMGPLIVDGGWAKRVVSINWETFTPRL